MTEKIHTMYGKLMYLLYNWKIRELTNFFFTSNLVRDNFKKIDEGKKIVDVYSSKTTYKN